MRNIIYILCVSLCLISCGNSNERKVESAFRNYVSIHFDDPRNLDEIVSIDSCDTITIKEIQSILKDIKNTYDSIQRISKRQTVEINEYLKDNRLRGIMRKNPNLEEVLHEYRNLLAEQISMQYGDLSSAMYGIGSTLNERYEGFMKKKGNTFIQYKIHARVIKDSKKTIKTYYAVSDTLFNNINIRTKGVQTDEVVGSDVITDYSEISDEYISRAKVAKEIDEYQKVIISVVKHDLQ